MSLPIDSLPVDKVAMPEPEMRLVKYEGLITQRPLPPIPIPREHIFLASLATVSREIKYEFPCSDLHMFYPATANQMRPVKPILRYNALSPDLEEIDAKPRNMDSIEKTDAKPPNMDDAESSSSKTTRLGGVPVFESTLPYNQFIEVSHQSSRPQVSISGLSHLL